MNEHYRDPSSFRTSSTSTKMRIEVINGDSGADAIAIGRTAILNLACNSHPGGGWEALCDLFCAWEMAGDFFTTASGLAIDERNDANSHGRSCVRRQIMIRDTQSLEGNIYWYHTDECCSHVKHYIGKYQSVDNASWNFYNHIMFNNLEIQSAANFFSARSMLRENDTKWGS